MNNNDIEVPSIDEATAAEGNASFTDGVTVSIKADTSEFVEAIERATECIQELRDAAEEANAALAELTDADGEADADTEE